MKKNVTQDIVPPRKSIRDVELPSRTKEEKKISRSSREDVFERAVPISVPKKESAYHDEPIKIENSSTDSAYQPSSYKYSYETPVKSSRLKYIIVGICLLLFTSFFFISFFFKSATVTITPVTQSKSINDTFTAKKDVSANTLSYQVVTITKDLEKAVDPKDITSEQKVERKAKGTIVIYNNFNSSPLKLVATTRFQTPEGLIFRLVSPVSIPGKFTKDGKMVPGSIEAEVVADQAGQNYNIGLKDFTIPGLKTDPEKYKLVYARSKTEMTGGFSGVDKVVSKEALASVESEMQATLQDALAKDVVAQIPGDFVLFQNSMVYKFDAVTSVTTSGGTTVAKKKGVVMAVIFDKKMLNSTIVAKLLPGISADTVKVANLDSLSFKVATNTPVSATSNSIEFIISGDVNFVWNIDHDKLKSDLLGLSKNNAKTVMSAYPSIKEAWILTRPFWNTKIPTDPNKVKIVNTVAQ